MLKILMFGWEFPPYNSGGLGTACYNLTKKLSKKGAKIIFVLPKKFNIKCDFLKLVYSNDDDLYDKVYAINSLLYPYLTSENYKNFAFLANDVPEHLKYFYGLSLIEEVKRYAELSKRIALCENFDIIHAHDWLTFKAGIEAKKISGKPLIVHVHSTEFDRTGGIGYNPEVYEIEKEGLLEADKIIAVSNFTKNKIIENYGIKPEKIEVVHNGVEFDNYELSLASKLKQNNKIVLFLGRITIQKGPDYFVYAAKRVLEKMNNVIFLIAGSGDMERKIIEKTAELGISDKVLFTGFLRGDDLRKAYKLADVYVLPSVSEPFGITPLESMNYGTPVIISKQSGVSEVINHCLKVDFWDVDEIANKIIAILKYDELKKTLQEHGHQEVQKITWDQPAEKCLNIYQEVLSKK